MCRYCNTITNLQVKANGASVWRVCISHLAPKLLKEIDIFDGSLLVAAYPLRCMGGYGGVYGCENL